MKIAFEGKIDLPRAEQLLESKGLGLNGPVQQFHTKNVLRRIQKYMPYRTGATIKLTIAQTDIHEPYIVTDTVCAKRLFNGMTAAGKPLHYTKIKNPQAGPHWDWALVAAEGEALTADLQRYIARRGK